MVNFLVKLDTFSMMEYPIETWHDYTLSNVFVEELIEIILDGVVLAWWFFELNLITWLIAR